MIHEKDITKIIGDYLKNQPVLKAYLFGSVARGESTHNSDIDLLIELDRSQPVGLGFIQMQLDLQDLLSRPIDLVTQKSLSKHIRPFVDKEKQLIYEKEDRG